MIWEDVDSLTCVGFDTLGQPREVSTEHRDRAAVTAAVSEYLGVVDEDGRPTKVCIVWYAQGRGRIENW